jgi:DNA modification methylase
MTNTVQTKYLYVEGEIPLDIPKGTFISIQRKTPLKIYSLGFQPAKSIPEIPRWFLQKYARKEFTVLEPFAGSGTTIIEGIKNQLSVYWLDYHPLSQLNCQVKTTLWQSEEILAEKERILKNSFWQKDAPETINFTKRDFWFQKPVREGLEILKHQIIKSPPNTQKLLWLAYASTARKTSNMNDGMLLAARRSKFEEIPQRSREDTLNYFEFYVDKALEAIREWNPFLSKYIGRIKEVFPGDARRVSGDWKCDAIVTSPPYINAIDYVWAAKFELHWLGMVKSDRDRLNLYSNEIGTERIPKQEWKELGITGYQNLDRLIEDIYFAKKYRASQGQNQLRARVVYQYFVDMKSHFQSCYKRLRKGGYYCFAIGDVSKICGVEIPVASILSEIARDVGFKKIFDFHLLLKNRKLNLPRNVDWAGNIERDTIVVLEKV